MMGPLTMKRRAFNAVSAATAVFAAITPGIARPQGGFVEGTHYVRLNQPAPTPAGDKIDVIEFFWYGCPHCNAFEPMLEPWARRLPGDTAFRRVPVAFRDEPFVAHQRIFYALEALGQVAAMHAKVFYAIHRERQRLDKPAEIQGFMTRNGIDGAKFLDAYNSFGVQTKARQAQRLSEQYKIDGVPSIGVNGRYWTSGTLAGGSEGMLAAADFLIARARAERGGPPPPKS
jgi:protein dithiol oxidoreductase (disulfide-forming)